MNLTIISPTHTHTYTVQWCEIETPVGNFVIQKGHAPTILAAVPGNSITYCLETGAQISVAVTYAIVTVSRTAVTILLHGS